VRWLEAGGKRIGILTIGARSNVDHHPLFGCVRAGRRNGRQDDRRDERDE
jgi:hypothetical protein